MEELTEIKLNNLWARQDNANIMSDELFQKLVEHIKNSGRYPPLIVRPAANDNSAYEILDGHHRKRALESLGCEFAMCLIWDVDDTEALVLLTTLNRLQGQDDILKRSKLVCRLVENFGKSKLTRILPENMEKLNQLLEIRLPPPAPAVAPDILEMPQAVTFFLNHKQKQNLTDKLQNYEGATPSQKFISLMGLNN